MTSPWVVWANDARVEAERERARLAACGAWALGLLGVALAVPAAREDAALDVEAYAELLDGPSSFELNDAAAIIRGHDP